MRLGHRDAVSSIPWGGAGGGQERSGKKFTLPHPRKLFLLGFGPLFFFILLNFLEKKITFENKYLNEIVRAIRFNSEDKFIVNSTIWQYNIKFCLGHDMDFIYEKWISDIKFK